MAIAFYLSFQKFENKIFLFLETLHLGPTSQRTMTLARSQAILFIFLQGIQFCTPFYAQYKGWMRNQAFYNETNIVS